VETRNWRLLKIRLFGVEFEAVGKWERLYGGGYKWKFNGYLQDRRKTYNKIRQVADKRRARSIESNDTYIKYWPREKKLRIKVFSELCTLGDIFISGNEKWLEQGDRNFQILADDWWEWD